MSRSPLISVITPTWRRHELLIERCIPAVQAQSYPEVEHIVVSDGPDADLATRLSLLRQWREWGNLVFLQLPEHDSAEHWGHLARLRGLEEARGEFIAYCDDDDALRPEHCAVMVQALQDNPTAGFAVSRMMCHGPARSAVTGWGPLGCGNVGTPMIVHAREILAYGTWGPASFTEDWELVERWLNAGVKYANVDAETSDVWPSTYRGGQ